MIGASVNTHLSALAGYRQMTIELATALVYGQAFVGWLSIIVLRVLTIPSQKPKD